MPFSWHANHTSEQHAFLEYVNCAARVYATILNGKCLFTVAPVRVCTMFEQSTHTQTCTHIANSIKEDTTHARVRSAKHLGLLIYAL